MTSTKPIKALKIGENIYNLEQNEAKLMFDKYYANKKDQKVH